MVPEDDAVPLLPDETLILDKRGHLTATPAQLLATKLLSIPSNASRIPTLLGGKRKAALVEWWGEDSEEEPTDEEDEHPSSSTSIMQELATDTPTQRSTIFDI